MPPPIGLDEAMARAGGRARALPPERAGPHRALGRRLDEDGEG